MLGSLKNIEWDDLTEAILLSSLQYSWDSATALLMVSRQVLSCTLWLNSKGQAKEVHTMIWILDALHFKLRESGFGKNNQRSWIYPASFYVVILCMKNFSGYNKTYV